MYLDKNDYDICGVTLNAIIYPHRVSLKIFMTTTEIEPTILGWDGTPTLREILSEKDSIK